MIFSCTQSKSCEVYMVLGVVLYEQDKVSSFSGVLRLYKICFLNPTSPASSDSSCDFIIYSIQQKPLNNHNLILSIFLLFDNICKPKQCIFIVFVFWSAGVWNYQGIYWNKDKLIIRLSPLVWDIGKDNIGPETFFILSNRE